MIAQLPSLDQYPDLKLWAKALLRYLHDRGIDTDDALQQSPPIGSQVKHDGSVAPAGWMKCNGASYPQSRYPVLAASYGVTSGSFNVPSVSGYIIRHD